jgi:hypothetical protein
VLAAGHPKPTPVRAPPAGTLRGVTTNPCPPPAYWAETEGAVTARPMATKAAPTASPRTGRGRWLVQVVRYMTLTVRLTVTITVRLTVPTDGRR